MKKNTWGLLCALLLLGVSVHVVRADAPGQVYYANFYNSGGTWTTGKLLSSSPNSWKHGWPEVGPSGPLPDVHSWCTARVRNPYTGLLSGGYYGREHSYVMSPRINLSAEGFGWAVKIDWMDYLNVHSGSASVEVSNNWGLTWKQMYRGSGNQLVLGSWRSGLSRTLSPDFCTSGFRIRFRVDTYQQAYSAYQGYFFDSVSVSLVTASGGYTVPNANSDDYEWVAYTGPVDGRVDLTANTYDDNLVTLSILPNTTAYMGGVELTDGFYGPWYENDYYEYPEDFGIPNPEDVVDLVAYGVGDDDEPITFDNPVRLQFNGQAGKLVGWYDSDLEEFHLIDTMLEADDGDLLESLGVDAGYLNVGDDLVVWTNHMTYFVMYVPEPATAALLAIGGLGVLVCRRRWRQR